MGDGIQQFVSSVLIGLVSGSIYALLAVGIVLIFKTQRVVNFAQAEFATFGAFAFYIFHSSGLELPWVGLVRMRRGRGYWVYLRRGTTPS